MMRLEEAAGSHGVRSVRGRTYLHACGGSDCVLLHATGGACIAPGWRALCIFRLRGLRTFESCFAASFHCLLPWQLRVRFVLFGLAWPGQQHVHLLTGGPNLALMGMRSGGGSAEDASATFMRGAF